MCRWKDKSREMRRWFESCAILLKRFAHQPILAIDKSAAFVQPSRSEIRFRHFQQKILNAQRAGGIDDKLDRAPADAFAAEVGFDEEFIDKARAPAEFDAEAEHQDSVS